MSFQTNRIPIDNHTTFTFQFYSCGIIEQHYTSINSYTGIIIVLVQSYEGHDYTIIFLSHGQNSEEGHTGYQRDGGDNGNGAADGTIIAIRRTINVAIVV